MTKSDPNAYFDTLPRYALPPLQSAWDRASAGAKTPFIYRSFCKDMDELGLQHPDGALMTQWVGAVQRGEVDRPARQIEGEPDALLALTADAQKLMQTVSLDTLDAAVSTDGKTYAVDAGPESEDDWRKLQPKDFAATAKADVPIDVALQSVRDRMVAEAVEDLQRDVLAKAKALVARQLHALAEEMERG